MAKTKTRTLKDVAQAVGDKLDSDVLFYNGAIRRPFDQQVIDLCSERRRHKNILLVLVTSGGDADAAYRVVRYFHSKYEEFICYVPGFCKSAGTLIVLGANKLIFSDHGELGPLDVQMSKKDDLFQLQSGYTVMDALTALQDKAFLTFEKTFLQIEGSSEGAITVKTAGEMASNLTVGLFASLFGQVDPMHIGEAARALSIASAYGHRLCERSGNWDMETLKRLLSGYPSHGFVIDGSEAKELFANIREPDADENELANLLGDNARRPTYSMDDAMIRFLNDETKPAAEEVKLAVVTDGETHEKGTQGAA